MLEQATRTDVHPRAHTGDDGIVRNTSRDRIRHQHAMHLMQRG